VGVGVNQPREDERSSGIEYLVRTVVVDFLADRSDDAAVDQHIGSELAGGGDNRSAPDQCAQVRVLRSIDRRVWARLWFG
jgi:hypothetical protein